MKEYKLENKVGEFIKDVVDKNYRVIKDRYDKNMLLILVGDIVYGKVIFGKGDNIFLQMSYSPEAHCKQSEELYRIAEKYSIE